MNRPAAIRSASPVTPVVIQAGGCGVYILPHPLKMQLRESLASCEGKESKKQVLLVSDPARRML